MLFFWPLLVLPSSTLNCSLAAHSQSSSPWETFNSLAGEASGVRVSGLDAQERLGLETEMWALSERWGGYVSEGDGIPERSVLLIAVLMMSVEQSLRGRHLGS